MLNKLYFDLFNGPCGKKMDKMNCWKSKLSGARG